MAEEKEKQEKPIQPRAVVKLKKSWFSIIAPHSLGDAEIGESYLAEAKAALGRKMEINVRELTGNVRDQNGYLQFSITGLEGNKLQTKLIGYMLAPTYVKKLVRRDTHRIDDSFVAAFSDGTKARFKTVAITAFKTKHSIHTSLRKKAQETVRELAAKESFDMLIQRAMGRQLQQELRKALHKIYPLRDFEFKGIVLEK